jgi:hypothetical protein
MIARLFRTDEPRLSDYAGLALAVVVWLAAIGLCLAPSLAQP